MAGSVAKYLTRNLKALDPLIQRFRGSFLGQDTSEPQSSTGETQENMNFVSCRREMGEIMLKAV